MKRYKFDVFNNALIENGCEQEGYEKILPYKLWLTLNKISLTKPKQLRESLDAKNLSSFQEFKDFVDVCEEQGLTDLEVDHEASEYSLDSFYIICTRKLMKRKPMMN